MIKFFSSAVRRRCFSTKPSPVRVSGRGFSLVELLTVVAIVGSLIAMGAPTMESLIANTRLNDAAARMRSATLRLQQVLAGNYNMADRNDTLPRIPNAVFAGVALIVRWDDAASEYEIFWGIHN